MKAHFLEFVDPKSTRGLEIGAFDLPLVEPQEGRCDFADYHSTDQLRKMASELDRLNPQFVVPVTYVTATGYDHVPQDYDWVAACHVIEHVADFIGWLQTLAEHLKAGGVLFLGIPDKRYTFDFYRRVTTLSEAAAAHNAKLTRPSFYQVFDFFYLYANGLHPQEIWKGKRISQPKRDFTGAMDAARLAETQYQDVHCSVFTPESFEALILEIIEAKLIPYKLLSVRRTGRGMLDFSATLLHSPQAGSPESFGHAGFSSERRECG